MVYFKKKLLAVLLLFSFIIFFVSSSVNANMTDIVYSIDTPTLLKNQQEYLASIFLKKLDASNSSSARNDFKSNISSVNAWFYFTYNPSTNNNTITVYKILTSANYGNLNSTTIDTDDAYFEDYFFSYPVSGYSVDNSDIGYIRRYVLNLGSNEVTYGDYNGTIFIPSCLIMYDNENLNNYRNGISPNNNGIAMIIQAITSNTEQEEETTEEMKKLNSFMSSEDVDQDAYDMPTQNDTTDATGQRT